MNIKVVLLVISIDFSRSQHTQENVCYGETQTADCRNQNVDIQLQHQAEMILHQTKEINRLKIKDCSDLLNAGNTISGVYSIYTRHRRYVFMLWRYRIYVFQFICFYNNTSCFQQNTGNYCPGVDRAPVRCPEGL